MPSKVSYIKQGSDSGLLTSGGQPPHGGGVQERVAALEATISTIRAEIRAESVETRSVVTNAFDKIQSDTTNKINKFQVWALVAAVTGLAAVSLTMFGILVKPDAKL